MWFGLEALRKAMRGGRASAAVCLLLALFVLQTAVTHSHFHFGAAGLAKTAQADPAKDAAGKPAKAPLGHNEANCPLWHAAGICGAAVAPVANLFFVPPLGNARAPVDQRAIFVERFAVHWRSRAPPSL